MTNYSDYAAGEALLLTQVRACSNFDTTNSSRGNFNIVNSGKSQWYCILFPGPYTRTQRAAGKNYETVWTTDFEVWVRQADYDTTLAYLVAREKEIIDRLDTQNKAGDTTGRVIDVFVQSGGEIEEVTLRSGPVFIKRRSSIIWKEQSNG